MEGNENRRLRLKFKEGTILTKTQKKQGLKHSWILLKPHHRTISDVISDIIHTFNLHHSCPNGIHLSMGGFVLPPFESPIILKDKDLVSVKRKGLAVKAITEAIPLTEDKIVEKQPLTSGVGLFANEEFNKEAVGYKNESEEEEPVQSAGGDVVASKKRKASSPAEIIKKKRLRQVSPKSVENNDIDHCENIKSPQEKIKHAAGCKNEVSVKRTYTSETRSESKKKRLHQVLPKGVPKKDIDHCENIKSPQKKKKATGSKNEVSDKRTNDSESRSKSKELDEKMEATVCASGVPERAKKVSRNTRRKRMQRQWKRVGGNNNEENEKKHSSDADHNLVLGEVRPGHIRFASASKAKDVQKGQEANGWEVEKKREKGWAQKNQEAKGWDVQPTQKSEWGYQSSQNNVWHSNKNKTGKESFCWNGITNKRKGQKWGKENQSSSWKESRDYNGQSSNSRAFRSQPTSSWKQAKDQNTQSSSKWNSRRKQPNGYSMDFKKLMPLTDLPKVGDVVAYRLLELSSSWCPELSSFRVGKIASFDKETNNILLVPQAEYPLKLQRKTCKDDDDDDDDSGQPPQPAEYNEDGSLEIDLPSLVDVRVVKTAIPGHSGGVGVTPTNPANAKRDLWEDISEALSAKKAQYRQEDSWNKKESSTKRSWSHRTLRSSALDPNMAVLRSQNGA